MAPRLISSFLILSADNISAVLVNLISNFPSDSTYNLDPRKSKKKSPKKNKNKKRKKSS